MDPVITIKNAFPHALLQPFISHYTHREISIPRGACIKKTMPPRLASSIDFFLGDPYETFVYATNKETPFCRSTIRGIRTITKYTIQLKGNFISFTVKFHPGGMYKLLGVPMHYFTDQDTVTADAGILPAGEIVGRLMEAEDIDDCIKIVEPYLLSLVKKQKYFSRIYKNDNSPGVLLNSRADIKAFAETINLSVRQTERCFLKEVGIAPKLYQNLSRFTHLIDLKKIHPAKTWTDLSYETDYYDQAHMIKSFRSFLRTTPKQFVFGDYAF